MISGPIQRNDWIRLPSGRCAAVCRVSPDVESEVSLRYLDEDGVMDNNEFKVRLAFIQTHAFKIEVATCN